MKNGLQWLVSSVIMSSLSLALVVWCRGRFTTLNLMICANSHLLAILTPKSLPKTTNKHVAVLPLMPRCEYHPRLSLLEHFLFLQLPLFLNQNNGNQQVSLGSSKSDRTRLKLFAEVPQTCGRRAPGSGIGSGEANLVVWVWVRVCSQNSSWSCSRQLAAFVSTSTTRLGREIPVVFFF